MIGSTIWYEQVKDQTAEACCPPGVAAGGSIILGGAITLIGALDLFIVEMVRLSRSSPD
jgi:hypothetical protein